MLESAFTMAKFEADADFKFQVAHDAFFREVIIIRRKSEYTLFYSLHRH